jgi:hypothetical protein
MKHSLDFYLESLKRNFTAISNKYEAHLKSHVYLSRMAVDDEVIFEVFRRNLVTPGFFQRTSFSPDFLISMMDGPDCSLSMSFFGPLPDGRTDYTYSTLHHHDDFLLSTISAKGPGYSSLIFKQGYDIDSQTKEVKLEVDKYCRHSNLNIEFIDKHSAHTIFYPPALSMTYALWSSYKPTTKIESWKQSRIIQKNKVALKKMIGKIVPDLGAVGITQYREDYFYPDEGKIKLLDGQILPPPGMNFTQNLFHKMQFVSFNDRAFLEKLLPALTAEDRHLASPWIAKFLAGEEIPANYSSYTMITPNRNVHIDELRKCFSFK